MNLLQLIQKLVDARTDLLALLVMIRSRPSASDLVPVIDEWIAALGQPIDVGVLETDIKKELLELFGGKVHPKSHASDAI